MKALKFIGQILAALVYTCIYTGIMYYVIVLPIAWVLTLPWWGIVLYLFIGGGIIEGIISLLSGIGLVPYAWIVSKNAIATTISIFLILFNVSINIFRVWQFLWGNGTLAVIFGIVVTVMLLQFIYASSFGVFGFYQQSKYDIN